MARDLALFIGEVFRNPDDVRAIAPSSRRMAKVMAAGLSKTTGPIVEIGPGTGVFTRAILEEGVEPNRLTLFELNTRFCEELRKDFPGVTVLNRSAAEMHMSALSNVSAVISGVPLLGRPWLQRDILSSILKVLAADGVFTQFTYAKKPPLDPDVMEALAVEPSLKGSILFNLPPARVYEFRRRTENQAVAAE